MSLMGTLGKVAMGVIVAKGVGKVMGGQSGGSSTGGLGGMLGGLMGGQTGGSTGGLGGILGNLAGTSNTAQGGAGLGGLLGSVLGGQSGGAAAGGGLGGLLSGLAGQGQQGTGGLGGLLGQLGGATAPTSGSSPDFGSMFNDALQGKEPEQVSDTDEQNAAVLLRAMISAAKADGQLDAEEQAKITEHLGDVSAEEAEFVRNELAAPLDLQGLISSVPSGLEQQVYLMSLMSITLDTKEEAVYLDSLRQGLNISEQASNEIHQQLGAPTLYS
ncbi:tellurite resistance TerB family protein [Leucothrix sargassi]|nr:tellurite resistance TerB family protein [Leucothrix sargassi]